jgi:2-polyprenyl-6-methoxyphenol hydroxylase-like FAD-dependent oxidoreductase
VTSEKEITTDVCIAGGGPAGMVLAVLLARAGHDVLVLESHKDFKREFRGEVLMPLFTKVMSQVGLLDDVLKCHHEKFDEVKAYNKDKVLLNASIGPVSPDFPYALWMPQPELLIN